MISRGPILLALAAAGYTLPPLLGASSFVYSTLVVVAIFAVMVYGTDLVLSDLGEMSLMHTTFFAAGAYAAGILSVQYDWNAWGTLAVSCIVAGLLALLLGLLTLRVREFAFSLVTYAANIVCYTIAFNWDFLGASDGITGVPMLDLSLPGLPLMAGSNRELWPIALSLLLIVMYLVSCFRRSRLGVAALMVQMNPPLAATSGIDAKRTRLLVFVLSAPVTAAGGWLYAYQRAYVGADLFEMYFLALMLTAVVLVGRRLLLGPLVGTAILVAQKNFLSLGAYGDKILLGVTLVTVLCLFPGGLAAIWRHGPPAVAGWWDRRRETMSQRN
jgi:branched-chain amino acid transport system permease protein